MNNVLEYKGYYTEIQIDFESHILYGCLEGIRDFVNFESESIEGIIKEFHSAVDDYLSFCDEMGKSADIPDEPYIPESGLNMAGI